MHDTEEILAPFTFKNSESPPAPVVVTEDKLTYELFQLSGGGAPVKIVTTGPSPLFDLTPATPAELAAEFPTNTPTNGVWVSGKGLTSPTGTFFVKVTATQPSIPPVVSQSPNFSVIRDPSVATTVTPGALSTARPRAH